MRWLRSKQSAGSILLIISIGIYDLEDELDEVRVLFELCGYYICVGNTLEQGGLSDVESYLTLWKQQLIPTIKSDKSMKYLKSLCED